MLLGKICHTGRGTTRFLKKKLIHDGPDCRHSKIIKLREIHRGKPLAGDAIGVVPTSGKSCRGILSLRSVSAPQRAPPARRALNKHFLIQTNSKPPVGPCQQLAAPHGAPRSAQCQHHPFLPGKANAALPGPERPQSSDSPG